VARVISEAVGALAHTADLKQVKIEHAGDQELMVRADEGRIRQVLLNLVSNAIKFTPRGGVIRVEARERESMAEISVADSGIGISAEFLPHVFDRFRLSR
jgi:signal transduction histidine kinase